MSSGDAKLTLYLAPGASSMAVHIALHEIGTPFEARPMSFHKKDMRAPSFLAINPAGQVPTLLVDGRPLTEVAGCLFYLARRFPAAGLLPTNGKEGDPETEARAVSWMSFIASTLHPARALGPERVKEVWTIADARFGDGEWALARYSIVDIHLFRLYWRVVNAAHGRPAGLSRLDALYDRMMARPAVQRTIAAEKAIGYELPA